MRRRGSALPVHEGGRMSMTRLQKMAALLAAATLGVSLPMFAANGEPAKNGTQTPIKYVVIIFQENESFDHYFGTYPVATNPSGEDPFTALAGTPSVNGLTNALLTANPNGANPVRLDPGPNA